ncbi:MAG: Gfo/Idh/MocA family protein [Opitutales bacterium]
MTARLKVVGLDFAHSHMKGLLSSCHQHQDVEIVGAWDPQPEPVKETLEALGLGAVRVFDDLDHCLATTEPDIAILCPPTAQHADLVERVAPCGAHIILEKPFAATLAEADRIIAAMQASGKELMINWPLRWYPPHVTSKRLIDEGVIGDLLEVHYYDGNKGPRRNSRDKGGDVEAVLKSWWYRPEDGGGSLQDYLGYGVTLGTWFQGNRKPIDITCVCHGPEDLAVDEHSVTLARYAHGLSKYETRWGTFTNPWQQQPQPKCGFILVGTEGTISSFDYEATIRLQTADCLEGRDLPVDALDAPCDEPIRYFVHCLQTGQSPDGPLSAEVCRIGQQIIDTAVRSAAENRTLPLLD